MASIEEVKDQLFLFEPFLFCIFCHFKMVKNSNIRCMVRYYKGNIEYNPKLVEAASDRLFFEELAVLLVRITLRHPTERKPEGVEASIVTIASDMVLNGYYDVQELQLAPLGQYPQGQDLVFYAYRAQHDLKMGDRSNPAINQIREDMEKEENPDKEKDRKNNGKGIDIDDENKFESEDNAPDGGEVGEESEKKRGGKSQTESSEDEDDKEGAGGKKEVDNGDEKRSAGTHTDALSDYSEGWEENPYKNEEIRKVVQDTMLGGKRWGNVKGNLQEKIKQLLEPQVDYREMLKGFTTSVTSANRTLTRFRPNRRTGWLQMGSKRSLRSHILLAVDTSGSVSNDSLQGFFSIMAGIFKNGATDVSVLQFDHEVQVEPTPLKKITETFTDVYGRGGTSFQSVIDYLYKDGKFKQYDGLIYFTDGEAPTPEIPSGFNVKIMWLLESRAQYTNCRKALAETGRVCWMDLETELVKVNL